MSGFKKINDKLTIESYFHPVNSPIIYYIGNLRFFCTYKIRPNVFKAGLNSLIYI